jgi:hypothetical protein
MSRYGLEERRRMTTRSVVVACGSATARRDASRALRHPSDLDCKMPVRQSV